MQQHLKSFILASTTLVFCLSSLNLVENRSIISVAQAQTQTIEGSSEANNLLGKGFQQAQNSEFKIALQTLQQALEIFQEIGDQPNIGLTHLLMGSVYNNLSQYPQALESFNKSLVIHQ